VALPSKIDHSSQIKRILDSGAEGSVVGLALATVLETRIAKHQPGDIQISARHIYYMARQIGGMDIKIDSGANLKDGIQALTEIGAVEESVWPYRSREFASPPPSAVATATKHRIAAVRKLLTFDDVKQALSVDGPVVVGISLFEGVYAKSSAAGSVPMPTRNEPLVGLHGVVIVGYDDETKRVKFANSWGKSWGERGFGYLPYGYLEKYIGEGWTFNYAP
jgi:C1A family cysteine protease